jgi:Aspartyl protease
LCLLLFGFGIVGNSIGAKEPADESRALSSPAEVTMNKEAGRGGLLIVMLRLGGTEELPFVVDTGCPDSILDKSLEPKLGERLGERTFWALAGKQHAGLYRAPKLCLGDTALLTGSNILTADIHKMVDLPGRPIKGILGMDSLRNYCLQLDFESGKMRLLDSAHLDSKSLGKAFPMTYHREDDSEGFWALIPTRNLLGGAQTNSMLDTGCNMDAFTEGDLIKAHAAGSYTGGIWKRFKHFLAVKGVVNRSVDLAGCVWEGNTYTNIAVGRAPEDSTGFIGLRFMARHLVTLDFPHQTAYLKQRSSGPLSVEASRSLHPER